STTGQKRALNLAVRLPKDVRLAHFSSTLHFAFETRPGVRLNINRETHAFAATRTASALRRMAATSRSVIARLFGQKVSSKRDGKALAITSDNGPSIKSIPSITR